MMFDLKSKGCDVNEHGYCVLESVYDDREQEQIRAIFKELCDKKGGFSSERPTIAFHPLLEWGPEMAPFFAKSVVVDTMAEVFQDDVRLAHSGAAVFSNALVGETLTHWHAHYAWDIPPTGLKRDNPERVLCNIYVDGSGPEIGPLIVLPRKLNDSVEAEGDVGEQWEEQVEVVIPPGSAVIFDTAVWHCSKRGNSSKLRHLWGGHYQGWSNPTPHPEDNTADNATVVAYKEELPVLRGLLDGPK
jgi:hypothetical protein